MDKISSKCLNLLTLADLLNVSSIKSNYDGALLLTSFGLIIGKIDTTKKLSDNSTIADIIAEQKDRLINDSKKEGNEDIELIGDGSMLIVKDAIIKYSNNSTIKINEITIHCDKIIGFSLVNIQNFLDQSN